MTDLQHGMDGDVNDRAPGDESIEDSGLTHGTSSYVIGLALAAFFTGASFIVSAGWADIWGPAIPAALIALAIGQMGVHLVFFLHLTTGPDNTNNVLALALGVLIVVLVVGGSVWIMDHLDHNMMPAQAATAHGNPENETPRH